MECGDDVFELAGGGWVKNAKQFHTTIDTKLANQDHRMVYRLAGSLPISSR